MKRNYVTPTVDMVSFRYKDVVVASNTTGMGGMYNSDNGPRCRHEDESCKNLSGQW